MPQIFEVELSDGRIVEVESGEQPTEEQLRAALGSWQQPEAQPAPLEPPSWLTEPQVSRSEPQAYAQASFPDLSPREQQRMALQAEMRAVRSEPRATFGSAFGEELAERAGQAAKGALQIIPSTLKTSSVALDQLGSAVPMPEQEPLYRSGTEVERIMGEAFPEPSQIDLGHDIMRGTGQVGSMMVGGAAAKAAGVGLKGATLLASGMGGVQEFDDAFERARKRGDDPDLAFAKSLGYATVAALIENKLGVGRLLRQVMPSAANAAKKLTGLGVSKRILGNFVAGYAEEGSQRFAQNWIVDEKPSLEGVHQEGLTGAIVEGLVGLPGAATGNRQSVSQPQINQGTQNETQSQVQLQTQQPQTSGAGQVQGQPSAGVQEQQESRAEITPARPKVAESDLMVTIQLPAQFGPNEVPGYVQVDNVAGGKNEWSSNPEALKEQGYGLPTSQELQKLPQGKYTLAEARAKLKSLSEQQPSVANLVPAVEYKGETHIGNPGETHAKLINRVFANDPEAKFELQNATPESEAARGFAVNGTTEFIDRNASAEMVGMKPEKGKRPVLYSEWLNELRSRQKASVNAQPKETAPPGEPASISRGTSPVAAPEVGNVVSLDPASGAVLSGMDSLINRLESLKFSEKSEGKLYTLPHPDAVYAIGKQVWNDSLDLAIAGVKAGKAVKVAIDDAMANIRTKSTGPYDEAQARANLESALTEKPDTAAPGAKTKESGGQFFAGKNPQETAKMMQDRATSFLQGKTDQQAIEDLVRLASGDPNVQLDNQAANFVIKDLLVRASNTAQKTKNPVEAAEAWSQVDRLAELSRRLGAEDARSLVSRKLAYRQIDWLMPVLAWRGIVKDQWRKALGIPEGQPLNESVITPEEAKKRGLPELNGEQTEKIAKLSKEAEKLPQGVRRNRVMDQMVKEIHSAVPISKLGLLRDIWYASVLMRVGTFINVLAGSYSTGASFTAMAALDRSVRLKPLEAMKIVGQFIGGTIEGALIAKEVAQKGAWHLLPDAELRFSNLLSGKAGARFDNLEALLRRKNPIGVLAYTRRFMSALDYIGAEGTRDAQVLYAALTRGDQESLDALDRRYDRDQNRQAGEQARAEMGAGASRAEVLVRKREILEEGVSEELKEAAINTARRAAQNANPRGIPGIIYQGASKLPFWVRAPTGLAFIRAGMNMVQNAIDYVPGIGAIQATSGWLGTFPENHPFKRFGMDIPIEERRMMWAAQGASFGIAAIAAAMFLDDDKDEGMEISGSWRGLDAKKRSQLMELGERPNSIRFGKKGPWISFKQMPFAPPLAMVGTARDEERFHGAEWNGESFGSKLTTAWLAGLLYVRDLSALSGVAAMFDGNAWNTQENPTKLAEQLSRWGAQSVGRAAAGYIPSIIKEIDEFGDQSLYRPGKEELMGYWIRNIPYARRTVGEGPALNNFGEPIQLTPPPIKSWAGFGKDDELYKTLGSLASKGIFIPEPDRSAKVVDKKGDRRSLTDAEWYRFIKTRGGLLKKTFTTEAEFKKLTSYSPEDAAEYLKSAADEARNGALDLIKY